MLRKSQAKPVRIYLCGAMFKLPLNLELLAIPLVMSYGVTRQRRVQPTEDEPVRYVASAKAECNPRRGSGLL